PTTVLLLLLVVSSPFAYAQKENESFRLNIRKASSPITIDGVMEEPAWQEADVASDFYMMLPMDTSKANVRTDVRMTYDNDHMYLNVIKYHATGKYYVE